MRRAGLEVERLTLVRGSRADLSRAVLSDVSFTLARGALLAVVGPSGAGKSTLLSLLAGFEQPTAGSIHLDGEDWRALDPVARGVGMSFDDAALHEHLTVRENLEAAALPRGDAAPARRTRVAEAAAALGVGALLDRRPATLSAGERRRVSLGRAFVRGPSVALLDEPFANLDRANRLAVRALVRTMRHATAATTIVVTHDPGDALALADGADDRMLVLVDGAVRAFGPAAELHRHPPDLETAALVDELGFEAISIDARGAAAGVVRLPTAIERRLREAPLGADGGWLGMRSTQIRRADGVGEGEGEREGLLLDLVVRAIEPAGLFVDVVAATGDSSGASPDQSIRVRLDARDAAGIAVGARRAFTVAAEDLHLFAGRFPARRLS
ncbi:MAG: ATP-binding cassette domain-containing protein [Phycisphaera sp.]|nr:ATP-binding cassette domain-containing protein [Phycisphaera sp.]